MAQPLSGLETTTSGIAEPITITSITSNKNALDVVSYSAGMAIVARIDESVAGTTYFGWAVPSSSNAGAVWKVMRMVEAVGITTCTMADGNANFDNIWNDRASLTYL